MESHPQKRTQLGSLIAVRSRKRVCIRCVALLAALLPGCVGLDPFLANSSAPPKGAPCQIVTTWNHQVAYAPDPANGGKPAPGIAGRLYVFGSEIGCPLVHDGCLKVELYDDRPTGTGGAPVLLEEWNIDRETLQRLQRKDTIGWGYTLFLPWGTYKPELQKVRLKVCFQPVGRTPLYTESGALSLVKPQ
ncbi:MAG: hypothetical protein JNM56_34605 [Planctomycetia bacterium]|nr:hypothetical protein [Planctomycetia bacterium]